MSLLRVRQGCRHIYGCTICTLTIPFNTCIAYSRCKRELVNAVLPRRATKSRMDFIHAMLLLQQNWINSATWPLANKAKKQTTCSYHPVEHWSSRIRYQDVMDTMKDDEKEILDKEKTETPITTIFHKCWKFSEIQIVDGSNITMRKRYGVYIYIACSNSNYRHKTVNVIKQFFITLMGAGRMRTSCDHVIACLLLIILKS